MVAIIIWHCHYKKAARFKQCLNNRVNNCLQSTPGLGCWIASYVAAAKWKAGVVYLLYRLYRFQGFDARECYAEA